MKKYSDEQNRINDKFKPRQRKTIVNNDSLPPYMYIVCEGKKTEPYYIKALADEINARFYNYSRQTRIKVYGTGKNTLGLLKHAEKKAAEEMPYADIIWLVYDKDDFPLDDFDNTQFSAEQRKENSRKYKTAWSNECFEIWLLLHFEYINTEINRKDCIKLLRNKYIEGYEKNMPDIYEKLKDKIPDAVKRAEKLYKAYDASCPPSKRCPASRVYELIKELYKYFK